MESLDIKRRSKWSSLSTTFSVLIIGVVSCIAYSYVRNAPLLYDDTAAVLNNPDVQEITNISDIWTHDFWGYPMSSPTSHKSYRPFTVLMFRYLHSQFKNWSSAYHVTNIILHSIISVLFFFVCQRIVFSPSTKIVPLVAGLLFSLHPIHTEAVCGAVGCAELLSGMCFMLSLLAYSYPLSQNNLNFNSSADKSDSTRKHSNDTKSNGHLRHRKTSKNAVKSKGINTPQKAKEKNKNSIKSCKEYSSLATIVSLLLATAAMLCKESGMTVLAVLVVYELIRRQSRTDPKKSTIFSLFDVAFIKRSSTIFIWTLPYLSWLLITLRLMYIIRIHVVSAFCSYTLWITTDRRYKGILLVLFRFWIMGFGKPTYSRHENPASYAEERLTRFLTYLYLSWMNFYLLILPVNLSYDYSLGTIPLISTLWDARNLLSLAFVSLCAGGAAVFIRCLKEKTEWSGGFVIGCSIMVFTFLPASNLLFPVGFVIAERVLYLPSAGFIILVVMVWNEVLKKFWFMKQWFEAAMVMLICFYFFQTVARSFVWTSKERLFKSGLETYPHNPKIRYNWGNFLQKQNRYEDALAEYQKTVELQPDYFSALNNMGSMYEVLKYPKELVEEAYIKATKADPKAETGYANLARLYVNQGRNEEATQVLQRALQNIEHKSPLEKGIEVVRNLVKQSPSTEAYKVHFALLQRACLQVDQPPRARQCANIIIPELQSLAEWFKQRGQKQRFAMIYNQINDINVLKADAMKRLAHALAVSSSIDEVSRNMMSSQTQKSTKPRLETSSSGETDLWNRAIAMFQNEQLEESKVLYEKLIRKFPQNFEAKGQYGALLFQMGNVDKAEEILQHIIHLDKECEYAGVWKNLASVYGKLKEFNKAIALLSDCMRRRVNLHGTKSDSQRSLLLSELGKHEWHQSWQLHNDGKMKEAEKLKKIAIKTLNQALQIDPANQNAKNMIERMKASQKPS